MKKIEAIIRPEKLEAVKEALKSVTGYCGMSVTQIEGHGRQGGIVEQFRGRQYKVEWLPKVKLELVCLDEHLEGLIEVILSVARTGEIGDGKVFVYEVADAIRIRTGERGTKAL